MTQREQTELIIQEMRDYLDKCRTAPGDPNLILADRRDFTDRIDRLNDILSEVLDRAEDVEARRGEIERKARRESELTVRQAQARADDVYAASIIYTDSIIAKLQAILDETNESVNGAIRRFRTDMRRQRDELGKNEAELQSQMQDMRDSEKYLKLVEEANREEKKPKTGAEAAKAGGLAGAALGSTRKMGGLQGGAGGQKADVVVNKDAAYFKYQDLKLPDEDDLMEAMLEGEVPEPLPEPPATGALPPTGQALSEDVTTELSDLEPEKQIQIPVFRREQLKEEAIRHAKANTAEDDIAFYDDDVLDDADQYSYYDADLGDLGGFDELDDESDDPGAPFGDMEDSVRGKQVAGKIKDFLLGKEL